LRKKRVADLQVDAEQSALKKSLGAVDLTALGVGALVGAGIFVFTGSAAHLAGPSVTISFIVAALASALAALAYAELAAMIPLGGSAYTYAYASMGEIIAWIIAWNLVLEYAVGNMVVAQGFSVNFQRILLAIGIQTPTALSGPIGTGSFDLFAVFLSLLITAVLFVGVRESARANLFMVIFKIAALVIFIVVMLPHLNPVNLTPFAPFGAGGMLAGASIIFFAFIGFDAVSTAAEETRNPQRNLPIGILGSLGITTILYVTVGLMMVGSVPFERLNVPDPLAVSLSIVGETRIALLLSVAGVVATTSVFLVFQLGATRIAYNLARDGLIPPAFGRIHPRFKTPHAATLGLGLFVGVASAFVPTAVLVDLTNIGTLVAFMIVCIGVIVLRRTNPDAPRGFRCPGVPYVPLLGAAACLLLVLFLPTLSLMRFVAWTGAGLMVYGGYSASRSVLGKKRDLERSGLPNAAERGEDAAAASMEP
jgi:APA family basic amino acid/polyamine antiporter